VPCDRLKGHFSRIDHQMSSFYTKDNSHVLNSLVMHLPAGAKDAY
jgi:oligosaccharyltransferase complex subunit alpha (ribophorin I)